MIVERIKEYLDKNGISVAAFERSIGMSNASFAKSLKNKGAIGTDKLENILSIYKDISPAWLLTGEGSMLKSAPAGAMDTSDNAADAPTIPAHSEKNNQPKTANAKKQTRGETAETTDHPMALLVEKVAQQAEEIGRLKEQIRQLIAQKELNASDAPSSDVANVG